MAKRGSKPASAMERRRRELRSYLDQLRRIKSPTRQDLELMAELRQALTDLKKPPTRQ